MEAAAANQKWLHIDYITNRNGYLRTGENEKVDWGEIWRTVREVSPEEWNALREQLKHTYQRIRALIETDEAWETEDSIGGAIALVAHSAYHLGELRQATCTIKRKSNF